MDGQSLLILVIAGVVIATFAILNGLPKRQLSRLKVRPKPLMTPAERRVCLMIERAMPGARVHSQVSMGAIMNPAKGLSKSEWWTTFNKFSSKRVDFVVEDPHSGRIILLVELSGATSALAMTISESIWIWTGGLAGVAILAVLAGMFIGRASE